jgi:hypothetical protein
MADNKYLVGVYSDDEVLLKAVGKVRGNGVKIQEVFTPFPVHGLDRALGYDYPRMGIAAFLFGATGLTCALLLTFWTMGIDWPMNIGGKNFFPFPTNVPILFEGTVLFASFGMAFTFFIMEDLGPTAKPVIFDLRSTDDKFVMAIDMSKNSKAESEITKILKDSGAEEVNVKAS